MYPQILPRRRRYLRLWMDKGSFKSEDLLLVAAWVLPGSAATGWHRTAEALWMAARWELDGPEIPDDAAGRLQFDWEYEQVGPAQNVHHMWIYLDGAQWDSGLRAEWITKEEE